MEFISTDNIIANVPYFLNFTDIKWLKDQLLAANNATLDTSIDSPVLDLSNNIFSFEKPLDLLNRKWKKVPDWTAMFTVNGSQSKNIVCTVNSGTKYHSFAFTLLID